VIMLGKKISIIMAIVLAVTTHTAQGGALEKDLAGALLGAFGRSLVKQDQPEQREPQETKESAIDRIEREIDEYHNRSYYSGRHPCFRDGGKRYRHNETVLSPEECLKIAGQRFQHLREESLAREQAESDRKSSEIASFVGLVNGGNRAGVNKCYNRPGFNDEDQRRCVKVTEEALNAGIKSGSIKPADCFEWAIRNPGYGTADSDTAMRVRLSSNDSHGWFRGTVQDIDGNVLSIYFKQIQATALLNTNKGSAIIDGGQIAIGSQVFGFGVQSGTKRVTFASGERTTIPVISVHCISPVGLVEQLLTK
jgi:hypothetical protein